MRIMIRLQRRILAFVLLFAPLVLAQPLLAQTQSQATPQSNQQLQTDLNLPDWAAPANSGSSGVQSPTAPTAGTPPDLPDAPAQAPLDGGAAAMLLLGTAFAAYRLRQRKRGDPEEA